MPAFSDFHPTKVAFEIAYTPALGQILSSDNISAPFNLILKIQYLYQVDDLNTLPEAPDPRDVPIKESSVSFSSSR